MADPAVSATAGALALWQALTLTGPTPAAPAPPAAPLPGAVSEWHSMTMTQRTPDRGTPTPAPLPPPGVTGGYRNPVTPGMAGTPDPTTPLRDNPTVVPRAKPGTATGPANPVTDAEVAEAARFDPPAPQAAAPQPEGPGRALTVDEKRFVQGNALLDAAYARHYAVAPHLAAAGMPPAPDALGKPGVRLEGYGIVATESFDGGFGAFSRVWGSGADASVPGQITMRRAHDDTDSGAMMPPTGAAAGYGYGLYTFDMSIEGNSPGAYALLWPSTDVWPGPEMDLVELLPGGQPYSTLHRRGDDGQDAFDHRPMEGVNPNQRNVYQFLWTPTSLTTYVNGQPMATWTENVPKSLADGGENASPGVGMQTRQHVGSQTGQPNSITLYGFSYEAPR